MIFGSGDPPWQSYTAASNSKFGPAIIGEVIGKADGKVRLRTAIGGVRAIEMLAGEQLPRIY